CERLEAVYAAWLASGSPVTSPGARGSVVVHPLVREIRVLELAVDRLAVRAHPGRVGRPAEAIPGLPPPLEERRGGGGGGGGGGADVGRGVRGGGCEARGPRRGHPVRGVEGALKSYSSRPGRLAPSGSAPMRPEAEEGRAPHADRAGRLGARPLGRRADAGTP